MPSGDNNRKLSEAARAEIVKIYTTPCGDGTWVGANTIARQYGVSTATLYRVLRISGVARRSALEAHANGKRCKPVKNLPVGDAPACKCGCGQPVPWHRRKNRWRVYAPGHYTQRLEQNHAWTDGSSFFPYSFDWHDVAQRIRKRDGNRCQDCGDSFRVRSRNLDVHHINGDKLDNRSENLIALCRPCHARADSLLRIAS